MNDDYAPNPQKSEDIETWTNEHGQPDNEYLQALVADGSQAAREKLLSIAADLDIEFDEHTSAEELVGRIRSATRNETNTTS